MSDVIEFKNVSKSFGKLEVLHDIDLTIVKMKLLY